MHLTFKNKIIFIFLLIFLFYTPSNAASLKDLSLIRHINITKNKGKIYINLEIRGTLDYAITDGRDYIQIVFKHAYINPPKRIINLSSSDINKIFAYQYDNKTVRVRLYTNLSPQILRKKIQFTEDSHGLLLSYSNKPKAISKKLASQEHHTSLQNNTAILNPGDIKNDYKKILISRHPSHNFSKSERSKISFSRDNSSYLFNSFIKMMGILGVLLSVIIASFYIFKKFINPKYINATNNSNIKILNRIYIGPKKSIAVIAIGDDRIVVGITANTISTLARLDDKGKFNAVLQQEIRNENDSRQEIELYDELWEKV